MSNCSPLRVLPCDSENTSPHAYDEWFASVAGTYGSSEGEEDQAHESHHSNNSNGVTEGHDSMSCPTTDMTPTCDSSLVMATAVGVEVEKGLSPAYSLLAGGSCCCCGNQRTRRQLREPNALSTDAETCRQVRARRQARTAAALAALQVMLSSAQPAPTSSSFSRFCASPAAS